MCVCVCVCVCVYYSRSANTLGKGMNPTILPLARQSYLTFV